MNIFVYENLSAMNFDPISHTRATFDIRIGAETFLDRIQSIFPNEDICLIVRDELKNVTMERHPGFAVNPSSVKDGLWLLGNVIWDKVDMKSLLKTNSAFYSGKKLVGANLSKDLGEKWMQRGGPAQGDLTIKNKEKVKSFYCQYLWDILVHLPDTVLYESGDYGNHLDPTKYPDAIFMNPDQIFVGDATIQPSALINAEKGPVIIDDGVLIHGQTYLEGPIYIGRDSMIKPLTQIKNSVIGLSCKIGGEINTVIIQGFSNKVHEGHLGDAFLGEWVNLGAGTINSNLKNNYVSVKVQINGKSVNTNSLHVGSFLGDHVKTAVGTVLNTGTVVGPGSMIATNGFPPKTIRPFTWYVNGTHKKVILDKFFKTTYHVKQRRNKKLSEAEKALLEKIQNNR